MSANMYEELQIETAHIHDITKNQLSEQAAFDVPETVMADQKTIMFTVEQWDAFQQRLDEPPKAIPALQRLFSESDILSKTG